MHVCMCEFLGFINCQLIQKFERKRFMMLLIRYGNSYNLCATLLKIMFLYSLCLIYLDIIESRKKKRAHGI